MVQAAFGAGYFRVETISIQGPGENSCDWHEGGCEKNWEADQDNVSAFFEVVIPIYDQLEINLAGRYTDYGGGVGDSFDPKISFLYQPFEMLSFRGSFSSAFIAPTLTQQFSAESCGLQTMIDPIANDFFATFRVRCLTGTPTLTPETADITSFGFSLSLLDGDLNLGVDWINYDFEDRIASTTGQQVIDQDLQRFAALGFDLNNAADVAAWIGPNKGTPNGESLNLIRDISGLLTRVQAARINAQTMEHTAWDFYGRYTLPLDRFGTFLFNVNATYAEEFLYDLGIGATGKGDGAGSQNETVAEVPPVPQWRANGTINWFLNGHSAMVRMRWIDEFDQDILFFGGLNDPTIESMFYTDMSYSYTFDSLFGDRETKVEIGARNVFDEFPKVIFNLGGIESFVHDIRGRMVYLRVNQDI